MSRLPKSYAAELTKLPPAVLAEMCWELAATLTGRIAPAARVWDEISSTRDLVEAIQRDFGEDEDRCEPTVGTPATAPRARTEPPPAHRRTYSCPCGFNIVDDSIVEADDGDTFDDLIADHETHCPQHAAPAAHGVVECSRCGQTFTIRADETIEICPHCSPAQLTITAETPKKEHLFE